MLFSMKQINNPVVMRLNETMSIIGDNSLMKDTFEQVESQTMSIKHMQNASLNLEDSIDNISSAMGNIRDNTHNIIEVSQNITNDMNDSITAVKHTVNTLTYDYHLIIHLLHGNNRLFNL